MADESNQLDSFEESMAELESIVERLDAGGLSLQETLDLFERGQALAAQCERLLDDATLRLEQLRPLDGGFEAVPLDDE